jgi:3-O-methylgallate 3,4-dioxygenase
MAQIVFAAGTSHSPQVSAAPSAWPDFVRSDKNRKLAFRGRLYTFAELAELRANKDLSAAVTLDEWQRRHDASQAAIDELARSLSQADVDVVVIVGDDQHEVLQEDNQPAVLVYWGDTIYGRPRVYPPETPAGIRSAAWSFGEAARDYPVAAELGRFIIGELVRSGIDVASSSRLPNGTAMGHAFGFVYRRLMGAKTVPTIPVMLNTYFPPNQPTPARCYQLGRVLRTAIEAWPGSERVAVVASGGLSHFVIDEDLDWRVLALLRNHDEAGIARLPAEYLVAGSSEILNWIVVGAAAEGLEMEVVNYVPSYRSEAGTGCAMGFARWLPSAAQTAPGDGA